MTESPSESFNPFRVLQSNASETFGKIFETHSQQMKCRSGCSQCCHAEFSAHSGEATLILEWFETLPQTEKEKLKKEWKNIPKQCAFLSNHACTIYEARPIICRTQGAPLLISTETKKETEQKVDACPLNFEKGIPENRSDWIDLNRLTHLQAVAQSYAVKSNLIPIPIQNLANAEGRIPLRALQKYLSSLTD